MTLAEIKREINLRLREVKADAAEYVGCASYTTLQNLIVKAIERAEKCNSASELEAIDNLLGVIEDCYNDCRAENDSNSQPVSLFDFQFELDVEEKSDDDSDNDSEREHEYEDVEKSRENKNDIEIDESPSIDLSKELAEIESSYERLCGECNSFISKMKLRSLRKKAISDIRSAKESAELVTATYKIRRKFKRFEKRIEKEKRYNAAKPVYDEQQITQKLKKANVVRLIFGIITVVGGAAYGLFDARWWPWDNIAYGIAGIGVSYMILSLIYAAAISKSISKGTARRLCVMRFVLAIIFALICLPAGLVFDNIGLGTFYLATIPFTLCGTVIYLAYRLKLTVLVHKKKK